MNNTLPFDSKFQCGLLYLLATDHEFLQNIIEDMSSKYLDAGESHIKLFKLITKAHTQLRKPLTIGILKNMINQLHSVGVYSDGDSFGMVNILDSGKLLTPSEYDYIKDNCYSFLKHQNMALAYAESLKYYENGNYDELYSIIGKAYKKSFGIENSLGLSYLQDSVHDRYAQPPRLDVWSSGFPGLDKFIDGGFAKKECVTVLSSTGRGKCLGKDTKILLSDGSIKLVQNIAVGDKLMGPDGKSRTVLSTTTGKSNLYKVHPIKGNSYIVNDVHLLSLKLSGTKSVTLSNGTKVIPQKNPVYVEAEVLYNSNRTAKHCLKGWRPSCVEFETEYTNHIIPPYILGIWLGDGHSNKPIITQINNEVVNEYKKYAKNIGCSVVEHPDARSKASDWSIISKSSRCKLNKFAKGLKDLNCLKNKHIPKEYIFAPIKDRFELLAGLLDTDGSLKEDNSGYDFIQRDRQLAEDVVFIARSLGFSANISECTKTIKERNFSGQYWRVTIYGDCDKIPVRLPYKKAQPRKQKKNPLLTGITIEKAGYGDYYGFEIDGDKQFLLGDWQVTHNTSLLCNFAISGLRQKLKVVFITLELSELQIAQRFDAIISGFSPTELATIPEAKVELQRILSAKFDHNTPIIKGFDRGKLSTNGLHTYLERFSMDHGLPDVVILDWIGCMRLSSTFEKKHEALAEAADEVINMSREFKCSIITSHQTNRSAVGADIFSYSAVSESFASLFGMDAVMTLGASDLAKDAGKRTLSIAKNRMGPDSVYVSLQGCKPTEPLNFRFEEIPSEEEEAELLYPDNNK